MDPHLGRRRLLAGLAALLATPATRLGATTDLQRRIGYVAHVGILYDLLTFQLAGAIDESIDRAAGRYEVRGGGQGQRIANGLSSRGMLRDGRWAPLEASAWFDVAGRRSRSEVHYDYAGGVIDYRFRGETFLLRRLRVAEDRVAMPASEHVDDAFSAILNLADGRWPAQGEGRYRTMVVRRQRPEGEGPDDVGGVYGAELVPLVLNVSREPEAGRLVAEIDLSRFSSWGRAGRPARIVFGPDRRPERLSASLILGTSLSIRLGSAP